MSAASEAWEVEQVETTQLSVSQLVTELAVLSDPSPRAHYRHAD